MNELQMAAASVNGMESQANLWQAKYQKLMGIHLQVLDANLHQAVINQQLKEEIARLKAELKLQKDKESAEMQLI